MEFLILFQPISNAWILSENIWHPLDFSVLESELIQLNDLKNSQIIKLVQPLNDANNHPNKSWDDKDWNEDNDLEIVRIDEDIKEYFWFGEWKLDKCKENGEENDWADLSDENGCKGDAFFVKAKFALTFDEIIASFE